MENGVRVETLPRYVRHALNTDPRLSAGSAAEIADRLDLAFWSQRRSCPYCCKVMSFREPEHAKSCASKPRWA